MSSNTELCKAIVAVNRVAIVEDSPEKVFHEMCVLLKKVMRYDRAGLTVYDPEHDALRIAAAVLVNTRTAFSVLETCSDAKIAKTAGPFEHQSRTLRPDLAKEHQFGLEKHTVEEGFRSLCSVPLVVHGQSVGVVTILSQKRNQYSHRHGQSLQDVANQIAFPVAMLAPYCLRHPQSKLICPRCVGSGGGRTTTAKYKEQLSVWGQKGGRH